jgi:hypothetical protein
MELSGWVSVMRDSIVSTSPSSWGISDT